MSGMSSRGGSSTGQMVGDKAASPTSTAKTGAGFGRATPIGLIGATVVTVLALALIARAVDAALLADALAQAGRSPDQVALAAGAFGVAFVLRAVAWRRVLPALGFGQALAGIHLSLGANHVLPLRLGEPFRVLSVVRRAGIATDAAVASTVALRSADILGLLAVGLIASPSVFVAVVGRVGWIVFPLTAAVLAAAIFGRQWLVRQVLGGAAVRRPGPLAFTLSAAAWLAEAVVVERAAAWAGVDLSWSEAVLVATVAVAAQLFAIAPGGLGTYEAAAVAAYVALGHEAEPALVAAIAAHGLKTAYSVIAGAVAVVAPAPSLLGRLRLAEPPVRVAAPPATDPDAPIVLFLPAYQEEATVAAVVARVPSTVAGRPVEVVVIDDGSTDATAERAAEAGAEVIHHDRNLGLGAAVRTGLALVAQRGAAAGAFCDADGEYPPEELDALIQPILDGRADYVIGSRFAGHIEHMRPHRRFGNRVLTAVLSVVARRRISDGQSGYRAFSPAAAADAEVIHDFNYAQVLTLDLLAKGFRYLEVPISYHFRTAGESFVRLGPYLRHVIPGVYRELNGRG